MSGRDVNEELASEMGGHIVCASMGGLFVDAIWACGNVEDSILFVCRIRPAWDIKKVASNGPKEMAASLDVNRA